MTILETITIPDNGGLTTITVEWACPTCKKPRGALMAPTIKTAMSMWSNPCGHTDFYDKVLKETRYETVIIAEYINGRNTGKLLTVTVPWVCLVCSGPRGKPSMWGSAHNWTNACGHSEKFEDVAKQAVMNGGSISNGNVIGIKIFITKVDKKENIYDGQVCISCKNFSPYAAPNLPENKFKCYGCR